MRESRIRRLPVVDKGKLVGIVTYRDLIEAAPSDATTLSVHELNYLLSKIKVKDIMAKEVITVSPDDTSEYASDLGHKHGVGGLPVLDKDGKLIGIVTETDVFRAYNAILGASEDLQRITLRDVDVQHGTISKISKLVEDAGGTVISIFSIHQRASDLRMVVLRIESKRPKEIVDSLKGEGYVVEG
jgi:acetoin utilization protein AcuB